MGLAHSPKSFKIAFSIILFLLLYVSLPAYLTFGVKLIPLNVLIVFYLANAGIVAYLARNHLNKKYLLNIESLNLQEKLNILKDEFSRELQNQGALQEKLRRYESLEKIMEEINQDLDLESIADNLASIAFSLIADVKGSCILYLTDNQTQKLRLFKTKKEDEKLIIKAKEGDLFDLWVLRHAQSLIIEDIKKDFRFDLDKFKPQEMRPISSLISAPFISDRSLLGLLRLDNPIPYAYSQDDLRFLMTICELGALALEDAQLYQKTRELAIRDGLTLLFTKGYFLERLKEEYKRSIRQGTELSLLMLDIDYFKNYNDKFGHTAGDIVLKKLSSAMLEFSKDLKPLIISRFGGEEFCIVLPQMNKIAAIGLAEKLRLKIEKTKIILRKQETNVTVSIGAASFPSDARDEDELIFKADKALYLAKQKGRNRVCGI